MLVDFFLTLRRAGLPVSLTEFLSLLAALEQRIGNLDVDAFYSLARLCLVKDEKHFDRFDLAFGNHFKGLEQRFEEWADSIPEDWLTPDGLREFSEEEKARIEALGGWDHLMEELRRRLAEQRERHQGGSRWIGTGGTSPFGAHGYHPEGVRIGGESRHRRAVKVWEKRLYRNLDDRVELGTRNLQMALRRLRRFARQGATEELALDDTIQATARNAGWLDLRWHPERHNAAKILLFLDVGGSMDDHVLSCEQLFSAARSEFRHLEHFYFHNCVYESVWRDAERRHQEPIPTDQVLRTYGRDYRLIFVGDASMGPYELLYPGGSVEHFNDEAGAVWMRRLLGGFPNAIWLNPEPENYWDYTPSVDLIRDLVQGRMYPLTLSGLEQGIGALQSGAPA